jgi:sugar-specific transcriptional regulator TrmB/DNA-binding CsgD family transcriptional regulator
VFEALGVSPTQERLYVALVDEPWPTTVELQRRTGMSAREVEACLRSMETLGLVSHTTDDPPRLVAAPPEVAIEALIARQQGAVERARAGAASLMSRYLEVSHDHLSESLVEIMHGQAAVRQRFDQLLHGTTEELLVLDKPPYAVPHDETDPQERLLANGVSVRTIYERAALERPEVVEHVGVLGERGEQARLRASLPLKLAISDRRVALVPLTPNQKHMEASALVHPCALLDALIELFELLWLQAPPLRLHEPTPEDLSETDAAGVLSLRQRKLLDLMLTGMKDEAIAHHFGVTSRTITRWVAELMIVTGAETRFQLGWQATRRNWV